MHRGKVEVILRYEFLCSWLLCGDGIRQSTRTRVHPPTATELGALELNVLYLLNHINANSGEQIEVRRLVGKGLVVEAIVDSQKRKSEILQALTAVAGNPLVRMDILTLEEALRRETATESGPQSMETVVVSSDRIPLYDEVQRYLEREMAARPNGGSADVDNEISRFSGRMIDQSWKTLLHAFALKYLVERFSAMDLTSLNEESRRKLHEMIRTHAHGFRQNTNILRRDLSPIFSTVETNQPCDIVKIHDDVELFEAVKNLVKFASVTDDAISRSFSVSPETNPAINTPASVIFWRTLNRAESLAAALEAIQ